MTIKYLQNSSYSICQIPKIYGYWSITFKFSTANIRKVGYYKLRNMWKSQLVTGRQWPKVRHETMPNSLVLSLLMLSRPLHSCLLSTLLGYLSEIPKTSNLLWIQLLTRRVKTLKKISDQAAIRATRVEFFSKINKRPWSFIRDRRVLTNLRQACFNPLPSSYYLHWTFWLWSL